MMRTRLLWIAAAAMMLAACSGHRNAHASGGDGDSIASFTAIDVYLERSGSMVAYDTPDGGGQLKACVNDIINAAPAADSVSIAIVNDSVWPYNGTIATFLQDRDIYGSTAGVGNAAYTDFQLIFNTLLERLRPGHVSVLVSDLIYSPRGTAGLSTDKLFNEATGVTRAAFNGHNDVDVVVHKFEGDYHGRYYPALNTGAFDYRGKRPFYIMVIAHRATIDALAGTPAATALLTPPGAIATYRFNRGEVDCHATILPRHDSDAGRWRIARGDELALTGCRPDDETRRLTFTVTADLSGTGIDSLTLLDTGTYTVKSTGGFTLQVTPVSDDIITGNNHRYLDGRTHLLTLSATIDNAADRVTVTLPDALPAWVAQSNAVNDNNPAAPQFDTTTMGLLPLLQGIYDAYHPAGATPLTTIAITLKK